QDCHNLSSRLYRDYPSTKELRSALPQSGQISKILFQRPRRATPEDLPWTTHLLPAQHSGTAAKNDPSTHRSVLADPYLPPQNRAILHHARPRDACLGRNNDVLPNHAVVPNVHEVINLC